MNFLLYILIGILAGFLAGIIFRGAGFGLIVNLIVGVIGGFLGGWIMKLVGLQKEGLGWDLLTAVVGALLLLWIVSSTYSHLISSSRYVFSWLWLLRELSPSSCFLQLMVMVDAQHLR